MLDDKTEAALQNRRQKGSSRIQTRETWDKSLILSVVKAGSNQVPPPESVLLTGDATSSPS